MNVMASSELVETALRVLKAWTYGDRPNLSDIEMLRQHALPGEAELPADELACQIVGRECGKAIQQSQTDRKNIAPNAVHDRKIA